MSTTSAGYAGPGPWDWQDGESNYPVFNPYPVSKMDQPQFMKINRNISVMVGETAFLPCRVKNLDKYTVERDILQAAITLYSYTRYHGSEQMMSQ